MRFNINAVEKLGNWANEVKARTKGNKTKLLKVVKVINILHFLLSHISSLFWAFYPPITGQKILPLKYPFLSEFISTISVPLELVLYTGFSTIISYSAGVFMYMIVVFCSEVRILVDDWANLTYDIRQPQLYSQQIKSLVARHVELLKIVVYLRELHERAFGFQIILSMILIFTSTFGVIKLGDDAITLVLLSTPFGILVVSEFYFMCWIGNEITDTFANLNQKLFSTNWFEASEKDKQSLRIVIEFSKKPVILTGAKMYRASLNTFGQVMKETFSLYTVLKTVMA